jgi:hypothetical protein
MNPHRPALRRVTGGEMEQGRLDWLFFAHAQKPNEAYTMIAR